MRLAARCFLAFVATVVSYAADIAGIWTGQAPGRRGDQEDIAFQFKQSGVSLTGKMFGDEFDLPVEEGTVSGDRVKFILTTTNYYNGTKTKVMYSGTTNGSEMELTRERMLAPGEKPPEREPSRFTFKLKKIASR